MAKEPTPKRRIVRRLNRKRLFLVIAGLLAIIGIGVTAGITAFALKDVPAWNPKALDQSTPSYIYDKDGNLITKLFLENRDPVDIDQVPDTVKSAFLSVEDIRFYEHNGLDLRRIAGALFADLKAGSYDQGASTITQQLVKRAFLTPDKTPKRKIQEAYLALQLERKYTKDEILELYLNQIYFGEGAYGIQSAAQVYFGKSVDKITLDEAALLAALPKAPNSYDPFKDMEAAVKRRNIVLNSMAKYGFISDDQAKEASAKTIALNQNKNKEDAKYPYPYFVDYVLDMLLDKYGANKVYTGGLHVYTTLDPKIQTLAEEAMANSKNFPKSKENEQGILQPQAASVVLDPHTGYVKAIVGGRDHTQKRQFNRATDAVRQPGSTFKPVAVYAPALENGKSPAEIVDDSPTKFGSWTVRNLNNVYRGNITYRTAVKYSVNVAAVKIMNELGISKCISFAKKLGITTLVPGKDDNLSTALGGITKGVKPIELAGAYGTFSNNGVFIQPTVITKIEDRDHNLLEEVIPKKTIAMKKTTAFLMTNMLESVVDEGTGASASLGKRPVAGKTGTTSDDKDAWFAGYTPELVCVVWMGHDTPKAMSKVYGGTYPAKIWKYIMSNALKDAPVKEFEKPEGIVSASICLTSGKKAGEFCPEDTVIKEYFAKGTVPSKVCDVHTTAQQTPGTTPTTGTNTPSGTAVCVDPSHGGIDYLANIPGPNQEGGCPPSMVQYKTFPPGQEPTAKCTIPEHQVKPKAAETPSTTPSAGAEEPQTPTNPST